MVSAQFTLKCVLQPKIGKKITKTPYFGGSRSFKVIDVGTPESPSTVLVMIRSKSVSICNHSRAR